MTSEWAERVRLGFVGMACALGAAAYSAQAAEEHHQQHRHAQSAPGYARQAVFYRLPETTLLRADGTRASFPREIDGGKPVVLNFVFTTCTAVCPVLSQSFAEFQRLLGPERDQVRMVSISIDPEEDTPERLAAYAKRFGAGKQWEFYTGTVQASVALQKAFQSYFGDKMHHRPMTFMRAAPGGAWVRLEGFATPGELLEEYRRLVAVRRAREAP